MKRILILLTLLYSIVGSGCSYANRKNCTEKLENKLNFGFNYSVKKGKIYYTKRCRIYPSALRSQLSFPEHFGAHPRTFNVLRNYYAKDKNDVYYCGEIIDNADKKTFEVIVIPKYIPNFQEKFPDYKHSNFKSYSPINCIKASMDYYAKDRNHAYYGKKMIAEAHPNKFKLLSAFFSSDNTSIFYKDKKIDNVDVNTFEIVAGRLSKDKNHIFLNGKVIAKNIDFKLLSPNYFCNKFKVFRTSSLFVGWDNEAKFLEKLQPKKVTIINSSYIYDEKFIYFDHVLLENADVESFTFLNYRYSKDKNRVYWSSRIIEDADPNSFKVLNDAYTKDIYNVYYYTNSIKNADSATFKLLEDTSIGQDKKSKFRFGVKID